MRVIVVVLLWIMGMLHLGAAHRSFPLLHSLINNNTNSAHLGVSVAIDGDFAAAGAPYDDTGAIDSGVVNVYAVRTGALRYAITNPIPWASDFFGASVALARQRLVVGAYQDDTGAPDAGCVYVYDLGGATPPAPWLTITNPTPANNDWFGIKLAISGDILVIGAVWDETGGRNSGTAYVYDLGSAVPSSPLFTIPNPSPDEQDYFGIAIAIDGTRLVVGAESDDTAAYDSGMVHLFDLSAPVPTAPVLSITHPSPKPADIFGTSVALSGTVLAVGALRDDNGTNYPGAAYVYDLTGAAPGLPILSLTNPTPANVDYFGKVAGFGRHIVVTARLDDTLGENAGIAYVYHLDSSTPAVPVATLTSPAPTPNQIFGVSAAFDGVRVIIGASQSIPFQGHSSGAAYIFGEPILSVTRQQAGFADVSWVPTNSSRFSLQFADSFPPTNWLNSSSAANPQRIETTNRLRMFRLVEQNSSAK